MAEALFGGRQALRLWETESRPAPRGPSPQAPLVSFIKRSSLSLFHLALYNFIIKLELLFSVKTDIAHPVWEWSEGMQKGLFGPHM